jgi:hypothetical protein
MAERRTRASSVRQAGIVRAVRGVIAAGVPLDRIASVKVLRDGVEIKLIAPGDEPGGANEWDVVLE